MEESQIHCVESKRPDTKHLTFHDTTSMKPRNRQKLSTEKEAREHVSLASGVGQE